VRKDFCATLRIVSVLLYVGRDIALAERRHCPRITTHCLNRARVRLSEPTTARSEGLTRHSKCYQDGRLSDVAAGGTRTVGKLNWRREAMP
jgi:hypothetical protein